MAQRALEYRRRREERQTALTNEMDIAEAAVAASELSSLVEQFTSNKLGTNSAILNASSTANVPSTYGQRQQFMDVDDKDNIDDRYSYDDNNDYDRTMYPNSPDPVVWIRHQDKIDERTRRIKQQEKQQKQFLPNSTITSNEMTPHRKLLLASHPASRHLIGTDPSVSKQHQSSTKFVQTPPAAPLDRASTPVMSNASSRGIKKRDQQQNYRPVPQFMLPPPKASSSTPKRSKDTYHDDQDGGEIYNNNNEDDDEDKEMPVNVQSPWVTTAATTTRTPNVPKTFHHHSNSLLRATNNVTASMIREPSSTTTISSPTIVFDRYYDAVCTFVKSKHSNILLAHSATSLTTTAATTDAKMMVTDGNEKKDLNSLTGTNSTASTSSFARMHQERECRTDVAFLHKLCDVATSVGRNKHNSTSIGTSTSTATTTNGTTSTSSILQHHKEGNFWYLLALLRPIGVDAILNVDDRSLFIQHQHNIQGYIQRLALQYIEYTPEHLWNHFHGSINDTANGGCPFLLKRRQKIVQWLEYCFNETLPYALKKPSSSKTPYVLRDISFSQDGNNVVGQQQQQQYQNHLSKQGFQCSTNDTVLLQHSLSYILAGRLHDAQELARANDSSWRAALWDGGKPYGYIVNEENNNDNEMDIVVTDTTAKNVTRTIGNPNRALWRRMTWKLADSYSHSTPSTSSNINNNNNNIGSTVNVYEAAIAAILSSNVSCALENPVLNGSWEHGLYVVYKSLLDRTIDELLHYHNNEQRQQTKMKHPFCMSYPCIFESERYEREQIKVTSNVTVLDDTNVIELLNSRPYLQQQMMMQTTRTTTTTNAKEGMDLVTDTIISILIGKSALSTLIETTTNDYCNSNMDYYNDDDDDDRNVENLRFLTHLALYLDSLSVTTTTTNSSTSGDTTDSFWKMISEWKNNLLIQYIQYLSRTYELTRMMIVYASLLPESLVIHVLPMVLVPTESLKQRKIIVQQLREYLSVRKHGFDLTIVRLVVRQMIQLSDSNDDDNENGMDDDNDDDVYPIVPYNNHSPDIDDTDGYNPVLNSLSPTTWKMTRTDWKKMHSILWLTFYDEHVGEALICTNTLLRQFLLNTNHKNNNNIDNYGNCGKIYHAKVLINNVLPSNLIDRVMMYQQQQQHEHNQTTGTASSRSTKKIEYAIADFRSIQDYIHAMDAQGEWMDTMMTLNDSSVLKKIPTTSNDNNNTNKLSSATDDDLHGVVDDPMKVNKSEMTIATRADWYQFLQTKRSITETVVVASLAVESLLYKLLTYPGGWLFTDDEDDDDDADDVDNEKEEMLVRRKELRQLRSKLIPHIVGCYENICSTTATWMSESLNDALEQYELYQKKNKKQQMLEEEEEDVEESMKEDNRDDLEAYMIRLLDETSTMATTSDSSTAIPVSLSSPVSPRYWTQKRFHLASICTSDTYGIQSAYDYNDDDYDDDNDHEKGTMKKRTNIEKLENLIASLVDATISDLLWSLPSSSALM